MVYVLYPNLQHCGGEGNTYVAGRISVKPRSILRRLAFIFLIIPKSCKNFIIKNIVVAALAVVTFSACDQCLFV